MKQSPLAAQQARRRDELWSLLGDLPPRNRAVGAKRLGSEIHPGFTLDRYLVAGA